MTAEAQSPVSHLVVIGASAGGVEALSTLLTHVPADFPAPMVIAQHVDPRRVSHLAEILGARTPLPVRTVEGTTTLEPGVVYVIPANRNVEITDHAVSLREDSVGLSKPSIDLLLTTAAQVFGEGLIAVILTGAGTDGAAGARAVKNAGGTVIIQSPETAAFPSMPLSLAPTTVDIVANLENIGALLRGLLVGSYQISRPDKDRDLRSLLEQLRERSGIDFGSYKLPTILRRLQRRMVATNSENLRAYLRVLQRNPDEYQRLVNSFLIKVTEFFRDPELFDYLRDHILPELLPVAQRSGELRVWSAGCATGEEAYSLAILIGEALGDELNDLTVRIFATDLDASAIAFARRGVYPATALAQVPPALVARYFTPMDGAYEIKKAVRGLMVFGQHDLGQRAPFPRIDLALCRNVLIYFTPDLQRRALQLFAFSLRDGGYLALGKSESVTPLAELFTVEEPRLKIYRRVGERVLIPPTRLKPSLGAPPPRTTAQRPWSAGADESEARVQRELQRSRVASERADTIMQRLPIGLVVVNRRFDILTINSVARQLLGIHTTAIGEDFIHLVQGVPLLPLRQALDSAFRSEAGGSTYQIATNDSATGEPVFLEISCYPERLEVGASGDAVVVLVTNITSVVQQRRGLEQTADRQREEAANLLNQVRRLTDTNRQLVEANQELTLANTELRNANEELLVASEEAQAATEEIETLNEELQATNEELETLNEELQATVEELNTTNDDLQARSIELQDLTVSLEQQRLVSEANRVRLAAILASIGDAVLVVDREGQTILNNNAYQAILGAGAPSLRDDTGQPLPAESSPQQRAARGEAFQMEFTLVDAKGDLRYFEANGQPVRDAEGNVQWGVVVIRDITDRSLRRLQDEFLALAGHELRTPLTSAQGYLELLLRSIDAPMAGDRPHRYASNALEAVRELDTLVEDMLDVGRLQSGKLRMNLEPVDVAEVVGQTVEALGPLTNGITLAFQAPEQPLRVQGDRLRLSQVVTNLVMNAVKYAPNTERVDVRLRAADGAAELQVQDYGPGIPAAALPHIFSRFYQVTHQNQDQTAGLGLGLYLVRQLVEAHDGSIGVESVEGQGATFTVRLPLLSAEEESRVKRGRRSRKSSA